MGETLEYLTSAIADRYVVERELGRGGMATVFAATDRISGQPVAVKVLHRDLTMALGPSRFRREIEIASSLTHPHILSVLDSGEAGGSLYLVMPLVTGESLAARLQRERQLPVDEAVGLTREVASALAYAHERGIVHRDIKPENILLQDGHALVADFGIARAGAQSEKLTQTGMSLGTPAYMSPEQAAAERELDGRCDQYSLACVLFEMLAGGPPFSAPTAQALMARHALEPIPSITIVRNTVPEQIEDALYRALAKVPADRFPSVQAFADALGGPNTWTTASRQVPGLRRNAPRTPGDRRKSRVRRAIYSAALTVPAAGAGWAGWQYWVQPPNAGATTTAESAAAARRVAVLYFDDLSDAGRLAPVADGLTESVIDALSRVDQLNVISQNGVEPYRGKEVPADSIGRALRAGTLVHGTVEGARGDSVRVTVRLIDASTGAAVGRAAVFRQPASSVLALRDSLSQKVAEFLRERIGEEVNLRETRAGTTSAEAWTLVQRADRVRGQADSLWTAGDTVTAATAFVRSDSLLRVARERDPRWSEPLAGRAALALVRAQHTRSQPLVAKGWLDAGSAQADSALALNARDAAALELRGTLRYRRLTFGLAPDPVEADAIVVDAERDLRNAVTLDPERASAWVTLSELYYRKLKPVDANLAARRAYEADAYLRSASTVLWRLFITSHDLEQVVDASHWCDEGGRRFPDDARFVKCQLMAMAMPGGQPDVPRAWSLLAKLEPLVPKPRWAYEHAMAHILIGGVIGRAGMADSAKHVFERARVGREVDPRSELAGYEAIGRVFAGDNDGALELLKQYLSANPEHRAGFSKLPTWLWRPLKSDPRFIELVGNGA